MGLVGRWCSCYLRTYLQLAQTGSEIRHMASGDGFDGRSPDDRHALQHTGGIERNLDASCPISAPGPGASISGPGEDSTQV